MTPTNNNNRIRAAYNSGLAKVALKCSAETFVAMFSSKNNVFLHQFFIMKYKILCGLIVIQMIFLGDLNAQQKPFKPKFNFQFDNKNSFIGSKTVRFNGILATIQIGYKSRLGAGYYALSRNSRFTDITSTNGIDTLVTVQNFRYYSMEYHYILLNTKHWEVYFPFELGLGGVNTTNGSNRASFVTRVLPAQVINAGVMGYYKLFSFIGLGGGIGYRYVRLGSRPNDIADDLTRPTYSIRAKLYIGDLFNIIFHNDIKRREYDLKNKSKV